MVAFLASAVSRRVSLAILRIVRRGLTYTELDYFSTFSGVKVVYNDTENVFALDVNPFGFLAMLMRIHRWHHSHPSFKGILVVITGDTLLVRPVYSDKDARPSVRP